MPSSFNVLFQGVTASPVRETAVDALLRRNPDLVIMPAVGRFAAAEALIKRQYPPDQIYTSDITLLSSLIGYLADPAKKLADLGLEFHGSALDFLGLTVYPPTNNDYETAASAMLAMKYAALPSHHQYGMSLRRELRTRADAYRTQVASDIGLLVESIRGIHYDVADLREPIARNLDFPHAGLFLNPPGFSASAFIRMFGGGDLTWQAQRLPTEAWDEDALIALYAQLTDAELFALVYSIDGKQLPSSWQRILAIAKKDGRIDYLAANKPVERTYVRSLHRNPGEIQRFEIYNDQEIIPGQTVLDFVEVNRETGLYYRDLFVHRLGMTQSEWYVIMTLDGRAVTAIGMNREKLMHFYSTFIYETFGISVTSLRYKRLGKLFMMALCSTAFLDWFLRRNRVGIRIPSGIITTSLTKHPEGKTDRGVMKVQSRQKLPNGLWKITYSAPFKEQTFDGVLAEWMNTHGQLTRKERLAHAEP